jgi:integrase
MYVRRTAAGTWRAEYRDSAGHRHSLTRGTRREAQTAAAEAERDVRRGRHVGPRAGRLPLGHYERGWRADRVVEATTAATDAGRLERHVLPHWRDVPLDAVTPSSVQAWIKRLGSGEKPLSAATVRSCHQLLVSILEAARRDGLIADNPARGVALPATPPGADRYLTADEVAAVADELPGPHDLVLNVLAYTGLRWGELAGLHVARLDLLRRRVDVVETLVELPGRREIKPYPKGGRARSVPLPRALVDDLAAHLVGHTDELVFPGLSRHTWARSRLHFAVDAANTLRIKAERPVIAPFRVHDLRHTYASWLVQDGVTLPEVAAVMGHASIATTMRYQHLAPDTHNRVLGALESGTSRRGEQRREHHDRQER